MQKTKNFRYMVKINNRWQNAKHEAFEIALKNGTPARKKEKDSKEWIFFNSEAEKKPGKKSKMIIWKP